MTVYYPVEWLAVGGPPEKDHCPKATQDEDDTALSLALANDGETWRIISHGYVLVESTIKTVIIEYYFKYMMAIEIYIMESGGSAADMDTSSTVNGFNLRKGIKLIKDNDR